MTSQTLSPDVLQQIKDIDEANYTYSCLLDDAREIGDEEEVKFINSQIQRNKREKIALKKGIEFEPHYTEELYFALMGA